jgi:hypothetical protein
MALWTCPTHGERYRPCCLYSRLAKSILRALRGQG